LFLIGLKNIIRIFPIKFNTWKIKYKGQDVAKANKKIPGESFNRVTGIIIKLTGPKSRGSLFNHGS